MIIDIYFIPAMSAEPERVFSGAKRTISDQRGTVTELRRVAKTSDKIRLIGLGAHTYSPCAHIDIIIFYTSHMNIDSVIIVF